MILKYSTVVTVYSCYSVQFINTLDLPCTEDGKAPWNGGPPWPCKMVNFGGRF